MSFMFHLFQLGNRISEMESSVFGDINEDDDSDTLLSAPMEVLRTLRAMESFTNLTEAVRLFHECDHYMSIS